MRSLEKRAVMVGQGNKLELWSEELWQRECEAALSLGRQGELPDGADAAQSLMDREHQPVLLEEVDWGSVDGIAGWQCT